MMHIAATHIRNYRVFIETWKQRDEANRDKTAAYEELSYPAKVNARRLVPSSSVYCHDNFRNGCLAAASIEDFLAGIEVAEADPTLRGITWLELYVLYRIRGGIKPIPDPSSAAAARATLDKQLCAFKRALRATVERTLSAEGDAQLFKPGTAKLNHLKGVGILGKYPTLSLNIAVSREEGCAMAIALSSLTRSASHAKHRQFINGQCNLIPHELKLKGKAAWDSNLPIMTHNPAPGVKWADLFKEERFQPQPTAVFHSCPGCGGLESSLRANFQRRDLDVNIKCGSVSRLRQSRSGFANVRVLGTHVISMPCVLSQEVITCTMRSSLKQVTFLIQQEARNPT